MRPVVTYSYFLLLLLVVQNCLYATDSSYYVFVKVGERQIKSEVQLELHPLVTDSSSCWAKGRPFHLMFQVPERVFLNKSSRWRYAAHERKQAEGYLPAGFYAITFRTDAQNCKQAASQQKLPVFVLKAVSKQQQQVLCTVLSECIYVTNDWRTQRQQRKFVDLTQNTFGEICCFRADKQ
ncbi:MAG: hypothetical protein ACK4E8_07285 [Lacibacter sp.]|jgi:hypothetical protein